MNIPLNFCAKCGNPRNPGERICRFCGEPFPENKPNPDFFNDDAGDDSVSEDIHENEVVDDSKNDTHVQMELPQVSDDETQQQEDETSYKNHDTAQDGSAENVGANTDSEKTEVVSDNSSTASQKKDPSYVRIPKKGLWISLAVILAIAIGVGITLFILSHRNSPSAVVKQAFEALKKNDSEAFCEHFNLSNTTKPYVKDLAKKTMSFFGDDFRDVEIIEENVDDLKAVVKVNIIFDDNKKEQMDLHLVKIDDQWKIEPLGDFDFGLDSIFEMGKKFGFGQGGSLKDDIDDLLNSLF